MTGAGKGTPGAPANPFALDGSANNPINGGDGSCVVTLTTTYGSDVLYIYFATDGAVTGVTDTGLHSWTARPVGGATPTVYAYYAIAAAPLSSVAITPTIAGAGYCGDVAFGVSGANTASPFDGHSGIGVGQSLADSTCGTITTDNANDFLIGGYGSGEGGGTVDAPFTQIGPPDYIPLGYQIVAATQSATTIPCTVTNGVSFLPDAIKKAP